MTERVLAVSDLSKSFGETVALRDVALDVERGRFVGLVGPNGAGKSTLLRCLLGLSFPQAGRVSIAGVDAIAEPVAARARVGYLPGETSLYARMRGRDALAFGLGFHAEIDRNVTERCLERFNIPLKRRVRTYSAGQKQMLALTIALSPRVPLYVLDEPDKALDASMRHALREILADFKARGSSMLISSHHIQELEHIADDLVFILDGERVTSERIAAMQARLARQVRATLAESPVEADFPAGTVIEHDGEQWIFTAAEGDSPAAILSVLVAQQPTSVEYGRAGLQQVYEALYVGEAR